MLKPNRRPFHYALCGSASSAFQSRSSRPKACSKASWFADHTFLLLFNPEANDPQAIRDYFASRSIEAVTPAEIRIVVMDKIRDVGTPA